MICWGLILSVIRKFPITENGENPIPIYYKLLILNKTTFLLAKNQLDFNDSINKRAIKPSQTRRRLNLQDIFLFASNQYNPLRVQP